MNFKNAITLSAKLYGLLEALKLKKRFSPDNLIDNYFPEFLSMLNNCAKYEKIAVSSTNGKSTMLNLINQILRTNDKTFITNILNNGMRYSALSSIILEEARALEIFGQIQQRDYYTMAFDEFELAQYFNSMKFDYLLLNNLFIDQKDFCTLEDKRARIQEALVLNSKINLVINADEPLFFRIDDIKNDTAINNKRNKFFYGFNSIELCDDNLDLNQKNDYPKCPVCSCKLDYKKRFYSHLGFYDCECGFRRPKLDLAADAKVFSDYTFLTCYYKENKLVFKIPLGGVHNAYNALGAIALAICLGVERRVITNTFENFASIPAADDFFSYKEKNIKIKTIKNPASLTQAIGELYGNKNRKAVFCLNDKSIDGIDTSWIWDTNFEALKTFENKIYICGNRFDDMALRLKYANVNPRLIVMDVSPKNAIKCCFWELDKNESMLILATPSLINEVYSVFRK